MNTIVDEKQVWAGNRNENIWRVILGVFNSSEGGSPSVLYIEYWQDEDKFFKEGSCSVNNLRTWGHILHEKIDKQLWNRTFDFFVSNRAKLTLLQLNDFASVIADKEIKSEIIKMAKRITQIQEKIEVK